jgi:hypothetical protein
MSVVLSLPQRSAVLILRLWLEGDSHGELRARITHTSNVTRPGVTDSVAGGVDDVCNIVKKWVEATLAEGAVPGDGGETLE